MGRINELLNDIANDNRRLGDLINNLGIDPSEILISLHTNLNRGLYLVKEREDDSNATDADNLINYLAVLSSNLKLLLNYGLITEEYCDKLSAKCLAISDRVKTIYNSEDEGEDGEESVWSFQSDDIPDTDFDSLEPEEKRELQEQLRLLNKISLPSLTTSSNLSNTTQESTSSTSSSSSQQESKSKKPKHF